MLNRYALASLGRTPTRLLFEGFPYLVTRVVPTMYHVIVLPDELNANELLEAARLQACANRLPTSVVRAADSALYIGVDGGETVGEAPRGGVVVAGRLRPCRAFTETRSVLARRSALDCFIEKATPRTGYIFGDLTKGGRAATLEERSLLSGTQTNGIPRGLARCGRCGGWRGRCLDPSPQFAEQVMDVRCRCDNDNRCAGCGTQLHVRKLNANYYNPRDGQVWHVPGFSGLGHRCPAPVGDGVNLSRDPGDTTREEKPHGHR